LIPPLDNRGLLPDGIHSGTWQQIEQAFSTDARREQLIANAKNFSLGVLSLLNPSPLYLAGSTFSDLPRPNDIEATIKCDPNKLDAAQLRLMLQLSSQHSQIKNATEVDFYVTLDVPGQNDFTEFFRYVGEKTAMKKNLKPKDKRGVVEVDQWMLP
jgi:hypothetical protein